MKIHDILLGAIVLCLGVCVALYAKTLVPPRHLAYGPGFFPFLIGCGLMLVGGGIVIHGMKTLRTAPIFIAPDWVRSRPMFMRFWIMPLAIGFYIVAIDTIGFLGTATAMLAAILIVNAVEIPRAIFVAFAIALLVNLAFASFLHVPLSWGLLTPISGWFIW